MYLNVPVQVSERDGDRHYNHFWTTHHPPPPLNFSKPLEAFIQYSWVYLSVPKCTWVYLSVPDTLAKSRTYIKRIDPKVPRVSSWPPPLWEQPPMCGQITEFRLFEKHQIFHFLEPKKVVFFCDFWWPQIFFWLSYLFLDIYTCTFMNRSQFWVQS